MYAALMLPATPMPYRDRVRIALREAMYYREVDPAELARRMSVSEETVRRWLRGNTAMSAEMAAAAAIALDAPGDLFVRPPATREAALAMMAAYDEMRRLP